MPLSLRIKAFFISALIITYAIKVPQLIDMYHVSRFAFLSVTLLLAVLLILPELKRADFNLLDGAVFLFFGINILSLVWANDFSEAIFTAQKQFILAVSYYLFRLILSSKDNYQRFISKVFLFLTLFALVVISAQLFQVGMSKGLGGKAIYDINAYSGHKNLVASFLFLLFGFNIFFFQPKQNKLIFYTLIGWQLLLMLLLRSRAVYMSCALFGLIVIGHYLISGSKYREVLLKRIFPLAGGFALLSLVVITQTNAGKDYSKYLNPLTYFDSASSKERLFVWSKTSELIADTPLLGVGSGNWKIFFPSKSIEGGYRLQEKDLVFTRTHNDFLEVWSELGALGGLSYLLIFGIAFYGIYKAIKIAKPQAKHKRVVLLALLAGYAVISFFDFPKERIEHTVMLAMILAAIGWKSQSWLKKQWPYFGLNAKTLKIITAILTIGLLFHLPTSYFRLKGDFYCSKMFSAKAAKNYPRVIEFAKVAGSDWNIFDPLVIPYRWYEGLGLYMGEKYEEALEHFEYAYGKNPYNFNVINNYASTLVQVGQYEKAIPLYHDALKINPKFEDGMFNLSYSYFQLNLFEEAKVWAEKTKKDLNKKAEFLQTINAAIEFSKQNQ